MRIVNFGRNVSFVPSKFYRPQSENEVIAILNRHRGQRIRVVGRLHSWSGVVGGEDIVIDLRNLRSVRTFEDQGERFAEVGAGCPIHELLDQLNRQRSWTLPSVGLIAQQAIAGAIGTATHGSGGHALSHYVVTMRIACVDPTTGKAKIETVEAPETLSATACSLGCVGAVLSVTIRCRARYQIEEQFQEYDRLEDVLAQESQFPLQQFYLVPWRWSLMAQHRREVQTNERVESVSFRARLYRWYRLIVIDLLMHLAILLAIRVIRNPGWTRHVFRRWLPCFIIRNRPVVDESSQMLIMKHELFRHCEVECFVRRRDLAKALSWVRFVLEIAGGTTPDQEVGSSLFPDSQCDSLRELAGFYCHHYPICVRRIRPDATQMSMSSTDPRDETTDDWYSISLISYSRGKPQDRFVQLANFLAHSMAKRFGARPHWGKLCPLTAAELETLYPRLDEFRAVAKRFDPDGQFRNDWIAEWLER